MSKSRYFITSFILFFALVNAPFSFSQPGPKHSGTEVFEMKVDTATDIISFSKIPTQQAYTMDEREGRGIISSFVISKSIQGIQSLIDNRKKKFKADYSFAVKDESFYDQVSTEGPFDPTGIRFKDFAVARIFKVGNNIYDTAFVARFSLDTSGEGISELMNNSIFRLKLDTFILRSAKVRLPRHLKYLNMDIEISFVSSYISSNGQINPDVTVGKFIYAIRKAPLDPDDTAYASYYKNLPKQHPYCTGQSFLIPRSAGYFKNEETNKMEQCWGEGLYSIKVSVKESSKNSFINKMIIYSSKDFLSVGNSYLMKKYSPAGPTKVIVTSKASSTN